MDKHEVAELLEEMGTILELKGANPFRARAYHNAARILETLPGDFQQLVRSGDITKVKGIGEGLTEAIRDFVLKGKSKHYKELRRGVPEGLFEVLRISGLGPRKVRSLWEKLDIENVGELEYACNENRLVELEGFGPKSQENVLRGIAQLRRYAGKILYRNAHESAESLVAALRALQEVQRVSLCGSIRRRKAVVKDIDLLASSKKPRAVMNAFVKLPEVKEVLLKGDTKTSICVESGMQVDLRVVSDPEYAFALCYFTGSKAHNVALRGRARRAGYKLSEYGLEKNRRRLVCRDEEEIYRKLGLAYIEPELREDTGEIEAAEKRSLPKLVSTEGPTEGGVRGIFHVHSNYSDGRASLEEVVRGAEQLGYEYIGISDHSQAAAYANGMKPGDISRQHREIDRLQKKFKNIRIFKGCEVDILPDGSLDYEEKVLSSFDFVIVSVHSRFNMSEKEMTRRIIRAIRNKHTTMLGHPTGRLLLAREGYAVDLDAVIRAAADHGVVIEVNANPQRLDLDWVHCKHAKAAGVQVSVNPDAHGIEGLSDTVYGVYTARRGWLGSEDVLNTLGPSEIEAWLRT